jgi:hypothetical protein
VVGKRIATVSDAPGNRPFKARRRAQDRRPTWAAVALRMQRSGRQAPMTDELDQVRQKFESEIAAAMAAVAAASSALDQLRALGAQQLAAAGRPYRKAVEAFDEYFPFDDQKVRRLCRKNAVGVASGHRFAQIIEGTWHVVEPEFSIWCERFKRGEPPE